MPSTRRTHTKPPATPVEKRGEGGKFAPGNSANPGGMTRTHREYRAAFMEELPAAMGLIRKWLGKDPTHEPSQEQQEFALDKTLLYALGKPVKPSEMPALTAPKPVEANAQDTAGLLAEVRTLYAQAIGSLKGQQEAGDLAPDSIALLGRAGQDLGNLLKTEAEAERASKLGALSVDELLEIVCQHVPVEQVGAALKRRLDAQEPKT